MNLSFDSIADLNEFLRWAEKYGGQDRAAPPAVTNIAVTGLAFPQLDDVTSLDTGTSASDGDTRVPPPVTGDPSGAVLQPVTEPAKRKRRTKAEIEADETAAAAAAGADLKAASAAGAAEPASGETPPAGVNPFEQVVTAPAGESAAADTGGESDVVTPYQHLTRAREFIAKHGMPKYNESFAKAGLDANVMGYTAYQRGVHMSALDELEKA